MASEKKSVKTVFKTIFLFLASLLCMGVLPWVIQRGAGDLAMALSFVLFYAVNPIFSIAMSLWAGKDLRNFWYAPLVPALLFLLFACILFTPSEKLFFLYAGIYLILGAAAMLFGWARRKLRLRAEKKAAEKAEKEAAEAAKAAEEAASAAIPAAEAPAPADTSAEAGDPAETTPAEKLPPPPKE